MTPEREFLKTMIALLRPSEIRPEMYADELRRKMEEIREKARARQRADLTALSKDLTLTEAEIRAGCDKARDRYEKSLKRLKPLEDRFEREVRIPMLIDSGVLNKRASVLLGRRSRARSAA